MSEILRLAVYSMLLTHRITAKSADERSTVPNSNMKLPSTCSRVSAGVLFQWARSPLRRDSKSDLRLAANLDLLD